jgi:hypothetical protein
MPKNNTEMHLKGGGTIQERSDGKIARFDDPKTGMHITNGLDGRRRVVVERPGGERIVAERGRPGFVQRPFAFRGHDFSHRTYVYHGRVYDRFYRSYSYRGHLIDVYAPRRYYGPYFYGWAYRPWAHPIAYAWGWGPNPWFGYYGFYFTPYPVYASPALWLTDYMIASDLQAEYQANQDAQTVPPQAASGPVITGVSLISARQYQTIVISGSGFGSQIPYNGDSNYIILSDITRNWSAGHSGNMVNLIVEQWTDSRIVLQGFSGNYGRGWSVAPGDVENVQVWNAQTGIGPATFSLNIGVIPSPPSATSVAENSAESTTGPVGATGLTPDVKQAIAQEVQSQIALESSEAQQNSQGQDPDPGSSGIARIFSDGRPHIFVAGDDLDLVDVSGAECAISAGDALQFNPPAPSDPSAPAVNLVVLASKGGQECAQSDTVTVAMADLQEMQNHMRETIDDGLAKLQAQQGQGGLPAAPPSAQAPPVNAAFAPIAPPPDPSAASEISQQDQQATAAETEAATGTQQ